MCGLRGCGRRRARRRPRPLRRCDGRRQVCNSYVPARGGRLRACAGVHDGGKVRRRQREGDRCRRARRQRHPLVSPAASHAGSRCLGCACSNRRSRTQALAGMCKVHNIHSVIRIRVVCITPASTTCTTPHELCSSRANFAVGPDLRDRCGKSKPAASAPGRAFRKSSTTSSAVTLPAPHKVHASAPRCSIAGLAGSSRLPCAGKLEQGTPGAAGHTLVRAHR